MRIEKIVARLTKTPGYMAKGAGWVADIIGCTKEELLEAKLIVKSGEVAEVMTKYKDLEDEISKYVDNEKGTIRSEVDTTFEPKSHKDLAILHEVDLTLYKISNYWTKRKSNGHFTSSLLCTLIKKDSPEGIIADLSEVVENYKFKYTPVKRSDILKNDYFNRPTCLMISMADFHLDKRTIDGQTMEQKILTFNSVVDNLVHRAYKSHNIEEILYITSNDFLHTDNYQESTTKLTSQQSSTTWYNAYEVGFDLQAKTIQKLRQFCNKLTVVHVPSNHARTKEYYMVHALSVLFAPDKSIVFNRTAEPTKVFTYGNTMIGMHHGDVRDYNQLPAYFASKFKNEWGTTKYAEIALADKHHKKEWKHGLTQNEVHGTRMFICPSLSGDDIWHKDSLFDLAIKSSMARVYDKEKGFCGEFEERI